MFLSFPSLNIMGLPGSVLGVYLEWWIKELECLYLFGEHFWGSSVGACGRK